MSTDAQIEAAAKALAEREGYVMPQPWHWEDARAALAAAQAAKPDPLFHLSVGIEATLVWLRDHPWVLSNHWDKSCETAIRALRPPASAETTVAFDKAAALFARPHGLPLSASAPAEVPNKEDVARAVCCPYPHGCVRPDDCLAGKRADDKEIVDAVMALLRQTKGANDAE